MAMDDATPAAATVAERRLRVLLLANDCNPQWPSLPIVGFKYARALAEICDVTVATHVRNRDAIEQADFGRAAVEYIDTEYVAAPLYRLAKVLRGGNQVAWSINMMMAWPSYVAFERDTLARFGERLKAGHFDLVHRITPMSPTLPSYAAGRTGTPFLLGPLNGNLDWPQQFRAEMVREKEGMRRLRSLYKFMPFARSTYRNADAVLAAFAHTVADLDASDPARIVSMPEIGYDERLFHPPATPRRRDGPRTFLFAGRLVPYKLPEAVVRAFAEEPALRGHRLRIIGDGPERPRLEALVAQHGLKDAVSLERATTQAGVAEAMRASDVFVFPSIRELGAGVVIEAMACAMTCVVVDYGAPGDLVAHGRGHAAPLGSLDEIVLALRDLMRRCVEDPDDAVQRAERGRAYAEAGFTWASKAARTSDVYRWVLSGRRAAAPSFYGAAT